MYAPTAAGAVDARPVRASEKMTSSRPSVAMTSANRCAGLARWWVEMLIAAEREHGVGDDRAGDAAGDLRGDVGERVAPGQSAEVRVDERDDRVEVPAGDGPEHEDDREQARGGGGGVLEQREAGVVGRELLRGDARADHERGEERGAEELGEQPARERGASCGGDELVGELGRQAGGGDLVGDRLGVVVDALDRHLDAVAVG